MNRNSRSTLNRKTIAAILVAVLLFIALITAFSQRTDDSGLIVPIGDPDAAAPEITARAAAVYSLQLDRQVYGKNEDEQIDPYSITKILTCYLALENLDKDDVVTITKNATKTYENGTSILLKEGEKISVKDLVYGALLASGNDAAYALGEAVSGSEAEFAELMNATAAGWGCTNTHFVNANGWKNKDHYTSAHDMAIIAKNCFANKTLLKMSRTKTYTIPETNLTQPRALENYMLMATSGIKGVRGGKTGSWSDDDCSIVIQYTRKGLKAALVILGDTKKDRKSDIKKLMKFSNKVTPGFKVGAGEAVVTEARVRHGKVTKVGLAADAETIAYPARNRSKDIRIETELDKLEAPLAKGDPAGKCYVYVDGEQIAEHALIVTEDVETGWLPSYLYISNRATLIILAVILVFAAAIKLLRDYNRRSRARRLAAVKERQRMRQERIAELARQQEEEELRQAEEHPEDGGEQPAKNAE